jgi:DNA polymerase-1
MPPRSKDPGYLDWQHLRLTAEDLDHRFPHQVPRNIALLNGAPSGNICDADLDCPEALSVAPQLLPSTGWRFGRRSAPRSHWVYRTDRPLDKAQVEFRDTDGTMLVELRGTGGLTVVPPSTHKESGEEIAWEHDPRHHDPAEVPLDDLLRATGEVAAAALLARHWPAEGSRDAAGMALTGGLLRAGWEKEKVASFVHTVAAAAGDEEARMRAGKAAPTARKLEDGKHTTGWPKLVTLLGTAGSEVVGRVRQWLGLVQQARTGTGVAPAACPVRLLREYRPFHLDTLPRAARDYCLEVAAATNTDPAFTALPCLATLAGAVGNSRRLQIKYSWSEPAVVWAVTIADSGAIKSPPAELAVKPASDIAAELYEQYLQDEAAYREVLAEWEAARKSERGPKPQSPTVRQLLAEDTTIQALIELLADNPHGLLVYRDELDGWLNGFGLYSKNGKAASEVPHWLSFHGGRAVRCNRKTGDRKFLFAPRTALSVTGTIQPGTLKRSLTPEFFSCGLAARLLFAMPPRRRKQWSDADLDPATEQRYLQLVSGLYRLDLVEDSASRPTPVFLRFTPDARRQFVRFYGEWAEKQFHADGDLAAAFSKLEGYSARFALLHHCATLVASGCDDPRDASPVTADSLDAGITLARWFADECERVYQMVTESREEEDGRRLVELIRARDNLMTVRGLMRANCRRYPSAAIAETALAGLVAAGQARWVELPAKQGKVVRAVELCMAHDTQDTAAGDEDDAEDGLPNTPHDNNPDHAAEPPLVSPGEAGCQTLTPAPDEPVMRVMRHAEGEGATQGDDARQASIPVGAEPVMQTPQTAISPTPAAPAHLVVRDREGLGTVAAALADTGLVGLDVETTGLNPRTDRARLLSIACDTIDGGTFSYLIDVFAVDPSPLWGALADKDLVLHNAPFDLAFLSRLGFTPRGQVRDTMMMAQLLTAGTHERVNLAACCKRWLNRDLDKTQQKSNWAGTLTDEQLAYAAIDVEVLAPLAKVQEAEVEAAGLSEAAEIENRCRPALAWLVESGVPFDRDAWQTLARQAEQEAQRLAERLDELAPPRPGVLPFESAWNWSSPEQVKEMFHKLGITLEKADDNALAGVDHPIAALLREHRAASKRASTYGADWLKFVASDGRVYSAWRQLGCVTGRMASGSPNLQNLPADPRYRACFRPTAGRVLVKADYSQIELRIAAAVTRDKAMIDAYARGDDLHTLTAARMTGKPTSAVTAAERKLAKPVNFGLIYGLGVPSLRRKAKADYGLDLGEDDARRYKAAFFAAYPGVARWHNRIKRERWTETRTVTGRRVRVEADGFFGGKANYVIQGTGGDGLKVALALLWERRGEVPGASPVLAVHDEIVVECDQGQAQAVADWLKRAMVDAMAPLTDPVPVEVEVKTAPTWGG